MKLRYSHTSPYARKVWMTAIECGLDDKIDMVKTNAWASEADFVSENPLSKIPALILESGEALFDSPVICEYLDSLHSGHKLIPDAGHERWRQLTLEALADGLVDAAVAIRIEQTIRPEDKRWDGWIERQTAAINRALDVLEKEVGHWGGVFLIGPITVACALGYLDFRKAVADWRTGRPHLAHWFSTIHNRRSVRDTEPTE
ncbi:glutathione S-transferase N-terminal domain-containing protein [Magnetospirillum sulfuroxidans]|uniref:Glutathione S-transferase N-terminal domain-containing protein n=1 Tax=Magnetospirillum sulfuroxidans TaxID=611300 RepID=A0ABS5IBG3_9PROT|nr:glutathione S-transferase N-terminal domain-containing protein [Magnetospirillum sulfuroxidans]MBR9971767.1 glutathione S-transferase N-terminal domain-containing protein [Magnetospirillum sulfuroxidans]